MSETQDQNQNRMRPGLRFLLVGSLAINLIVVGLLAGATVGNKQAGTRGAPTGIGGDIMGAFSQALSRQERREIGRNIRDFQRGQGEGRLRPRQELDAALEALRAQPFDPEPLALFLATQAEQSAERREISQQLWLKFVSDMSDAERAAYADRVVEMLSQRRGPASKPKPKSN